MGTKANTAIFLLSFLMSCISATAEISRREFINLTAADGLADNSAHTINCTWSGRMVITTMGQINFYDGQRFSFVNPAEETHYPLPKYYGNYHLYFDKFHHIWLKNTHTVTCVDLMKEKFITSIGDVFKEFNVNEKVHDLFVDCNGIVWLLLDDGLYNVNTKKTLKIRTDMNLQDLEVYMEKTLMLFFSNGLVEMYDMDSGKKLHESAPYIEKDAPTYDRSSVITMPGDTLFQVRNGQKESVLNQFDIVRKEWKELLRVPYHLNNIAPKDTLLFLPCEYGYWVYDRSLKLARHFESLRMDDGKLLQTNLNVITPDRQGGLWIGTEGRGLLYSKPFQSPFTVYGWDNPHALEYARHFEGIQQTAKFNGRDVNCVFKDSRGWTWVGTYQGLQCYEKDSDVLPHVYSKRDGLLNNVIHSIVEDKLHNIWVTTSYGISCLIIENDKVDIINSYNKSDRIPCESFNNGMAKCLPDGTIVLQSIDHIVTFNPSTMQTIHRDYGFKMYPKLTRLQVNGVEIRTGDEIDGNIILPKALSRTRELNFNYDQNSISLVFSALNFFRPIQTCYRVRVKGLQDEWRIYTYFNSGGIVDSRGMLHLPMLALRPGSYEVEVQASLLPDNWETEPFKWIINVNEPWWRTTGILALMVLILLLLLAVNAYYYLKNANLRAMRNSGEQNLIRRIYNFTERCNSRSDDLLEPLVDEIVSARDEQPNDLSPEFVKTMLKIMPCVTSTMSAKSKPLTMRDLSMEAGIDVQNFYSLITENIYKSPRTLIKVVMIKKAEELLRTTNKSIEEIARECCFVTPNYFIATFFHVHHQLPEEYRNER